MLRDWLGDSSLAEFAANALAKTAIARPATATGAIPLLDWERLDQILVAGADTLVVARGRLLALPAPRCLAELRGYFRMGIGLCLRHTEDRDAQMRGVADAFAADLGPAQVQVFVTPGDTHGFGWHFDDEDVFIVQTAGRKDYYFRANTATHGAAHPEEFAAFARETSPLCTATLVPGDFLYIPARWWHMAICHEDALSISVGVRPRQSRATRAEPPALRT